MRRRNGSEPEPGIDAGLKRRMRYLKRVPAMVTAKYPEIYRNSKGQAQ